MTALSLFDTLSREQANPAKGAADLASQRRALAEKLVAAALADLERVREYDRLCQPLAGGAEHASSDLLISVHRLYAEWADESDQIIARARALGTEGVTIPGTVELNDAVGRIRARLSVSPAQLRAGVRQAGEGQFVPAKELRDELRTRLRA